VLSRKDRMVAWLPFGLATRKTFGLGVVRLIRSKQNTLVLPSRCVGCAMVQTCSSAAAAAAVLPLSFCFPGLTCLRITPTYPRLSPNRLVWSRIKGIDLDHGSVTTT
jgi:hypothetical protein